MAVRCSVVKAENRVKVFLHRRQISERLIAARGVLDQNHLDIGPVQLEILHPAKARMHIAKGRNNVLRRQPRRCERADRRCRVVQIIDRRKAYRYLLTAATDLHQNVRTRGGHFSDLCDRSRRLLPFVPALGAVEAAKVRVSMVQIFVLCSAADAILRVGHCGIFLISHPDADRIRGMHDFPVAVQLVAEQVCNGDDFRMDQRNNLFERAFITFDDRVMRLRPSAPCRVAGQLRGNAG